MDEKISIIIPTYNCSSYICHAIESILCQSYSNYEIIIIDDGSTDNTVEAIKPYNANGCIRYVYQSNQGPGAARNKGITLSQGEYICFLDSDDEMEPESLKLRQEALHEHDEIMMVFSDYSIRNSERQGLNLKRYLRHHNFLNYFRDAITYENDLISFNYKFTDLFYGFSPHPIWTGTVMLKKNIIHSIGLFRTDISVAEDIDYWMRISERYRIGYLDKPTAVYNHHKSSLTRNNVEMYYKDRITSLKSVPPGSASRRALINRCISESYFDLGYHLYGQDQRKLAMKSYLFGLWYDFQNVKCVKGLILAGLPDYLKNIIKSK